MNHGCPDRKFGEGGNGLLVKLFWETLQCLNPSKMIYHKVFHRKENKTDEYVLYVYI